MFPLIPFLALAGILGCLGTLFWYDQLTAEEKKKADQIAAKYAKDMFEKQIAELTRTQAQIVRDMTKRHFMN